MRCIDFLHQYSALRDRVSSDRALLLALEQHLAECANCTRYHNSVSRGVDLLKHHSVIEPSPGFERRLRGRLAESLANQPVLPGSASVAAALMFASALTLGIYEVTAKSGHAAVVASVPAPVHAPATMPYAAAPRVLPASDFTLAAFKRRSRRPLEVVERTSVALGAWANLPR